MDLHSKIIAQQIRPELAKHLDAWLENNSEKPALEQYLWDNKFGLLKILESVMQSLGDYKMTNEKQARSDLFQELQVALGPVRASDIMRALERYIKTIVALAPMKSDGTKSAA